MGSGYLDIPSTDQTGASLAAAIRAQIGVQQPPPPRDPVCGLGGRGRAFVGAVGGGIAHSETGFGRAWAARVSATTGMTWSICPGVTPAQHATVSSMVASHARGSDTVAAGGRVRRSAHAPCNPGAADSTTGYWDQSTLSTAYVPSAQAAPLPSAAGGVRMEVFHPHGRCSHG